MSAEAECVRHGHIHFPLDRLVERVVQVAVRIGMLEVDGRGDGLMRDRANGCDGFDRTSRSQQVPRHTLRG